MAAQGRAEQPQRSVFYLTVTVVALLVSVYLAFQVIGFLLRVALLVLAIVVAVAAYRAWTDSR